jgi:hypothetical protein
MTECPACKLAMESHSTHELLDCCRTQVGEEFAEDESGTCPTCKHEIKKHSAKRLIECTIEFLKSGSNS